MHVVNERLSGVPEAFLIVVDDVLSLYLPAFPYCCTGIEESYRPVSTGFPGRLPGYRTYY